MTTIQVRTRSRSQMIDITGEVAAAVGASGALEGLAHIYCPHTTAGITVNEHADPDVSRDLLSGLADIAPRGAGWLHVEGNADAHVKASLTGASATVPISDGKLALGTWQGIFLCEFDGPRDRRIMVTVVGA